MEHYDISNDWIFLSQNNSSIPNEIIEFIETIFCIREVRKCVGCIQGIKFDIRPREKNHVEPHVHASYGEHNISIAISTGATKGTLPRKQMKIARKWVLDHKDYLLGEWKNISISATSMFTKSELD